MKSVNTRKKLSVEHRLPNKSAAAIKPRVKSNIKGARVNQTNNYFSFGIKIAPPKKEHSRN